MLKSALGVCLAAAGGAVVKEFAQLGFEGRVFSIHKRHESAMWRFGLRVAPPQLANVQKQN